LNKSLPLNRTHLTEQTHKFQLVSRQVLTIYRGQFSLVERCSGLHQTPVNHTELAVRLALRNHQRRNLGVAAGRRGVSPQLAQIQQGHENPGLVRRLV